MQQMKGDDHVDIVARRLMDGWKSGVNAKPHHALAWPPDIY